MVRGEKELGERRETCLPLVENRNRIGEDPGSDRVQRCFPTRRFRQWGKQNTTKNVLLYHTFLLLAVQVVRRRSPVSVFLSLLCVYTWYVYIVRVCVYVSIVQKDWLYSFSSESNAARPPCISHALTHFSRGISYIHARIPCSYYSCFLSLSFPVSPLSSR